MIRNPMTAANAATWSLLLGGGRNAALLLHQSRSVAIGQSHDISSCPDRNSVCTPVADSSGVAESFRHEPGNGVSLDCSATCRAGS